MGGLPFMSAFYSKEIIIEIILMKVVPLYSYGLIVLGITITLFYSVRFLIFAITLYERQQSVFSKHDINSTVNSSIIILFIPAVTGGRILNDSLGPNAIVLVHTNLKIFILSLIFFKENPIFILLQRLIIFILNFGFNMNTPVLYS